MGDVGADCDDTARAFKAENRASQPVIEHIVIQQSGRQHDVAEIQPRRRDRDLDFRRAGGASFGFDPIEMRQHAL